jgi:hypothetical protein
MEKIIAFIGFLLVVGLCGFGFFNKYVFGNKQMIDFKQSFDTAYVLVDGGRFEKMKIKAWKDYDNSDSIQIILEDGTPIYTHLMNVKLTKER